MLISLEARLAARCKACSVLTPMPGLRNVVSCRNCAASIDVAKKAADGRDGGLRYPFGAYYDAVAEAAILRADGEDCQDARDSHGTPVELRRAPPLCQACSAPLPLPAHGAAEVVCSGCGDHVAVRWPDDETRSWDPRIYCVVGDGKGRGATARDARTEGALVSCGHCGAPTTGAGDGERRRSRTCQHCGGLNYLTDAAWLALFPQPEWHRCYLVYSVDERGLLSLHEWMSREQKKYWLEKPQKQAVLDAYAKVRIAARPAVSTAVARGDATPPEIEMLATDAALTEVEAAAVDARLDDAGRVRVGPAAARSLAARWAGSASAKVRRIAAAHAGVDGPALERLAGDADELVRLAVAARPETPAAALARLRKDPSEKVADAVKGNPSYTPGFLEKLFG